MDTFLDLEKFYDSTDIVKLIQQVCQLKWNPVEKMMSLSVHMSPRVLRIGDLWGRMEITVQFHPPRLQLFVFLGQGFVRQVATRLAFPFPCTDWAASQRHQPSQPRHVVFKRFTGRLKQRACWTGEPTLLGVDALPGQVSYRCFTHPKATGRSARVAGASVILRRRSFCARRVPRWECRARKICQVSEQEGAEVPQKEGPHQSYSEWVETQTPNGEAVLNWDLASCGLRARWDGHVPEFYPAQKHDGCGLVWQEDQGCLHYDNFTLPFWRERRPSDQVSAGPASDLARAPKRGHGAQTGKN